MASRSDNTALAGEPEALEDYRRELTGYCYRMLGSGFEADDAVQETMVRAWRSSGQFEGRSSRAVLAVPHRHQRLPRHAPRPAAPGPADGARAVVAARRVVPGARCCRSTCGSRPSPTTRVLPADGDPAEIAEARDTIRLAFVTALQHLPPKQRAVLILLRGAALARPPRWPSCSTPRVAVGQQRAAAGARHARRASPPTSAGRRAGATTPSCSTRYVDAFERYDMSALVALLHEDAMQSMPPFAMWLRGAADIAAWMVRPGPSACRGSRLLAGARPTAARPSASTGPIPAVAARRGRCRSWRSRGPDRADHDVPRHRRAVPAVRPARPPALASAVRFPGRSAPAPPAGQLTRRPQAARPGHSGGLLSAKIRVSRADLRRDDHAGRRTVSGAAQASARRDDRLRRARRGARPRDARRAPGRGARSTRSARWPRTRSSRCAATRSSASRR